MLMSIQSTIAVFTTALLALPQANAQTRSKPDAAKASPVAKPKIPKKDLKKIQKANKRTQRRAAGEPSDGRRGSRTRSDD